jgi:hypothetical protein
MPWLIAGAVIAVLLFRDGPTSAVTAAPVTQTGAVTRVAAPDLPNLGINTPHPQATITQDQAAAIRFNQTTSAGVIVDTSGTRAGSIAEARAERQQDKAFAAFVGRAGLRSGPTQAQQQAGLLAGAHDNPGGSDALISGDAGRSFW